MHPDQNLLLNSVFTFWSVENQLDVFSGQGLRKTGIDNTWHLMAGRASKCFNAFLSDKKNWNSWQLTARRAPNRSLGIATSVEPSFQQRKPHTLVSSLCLWVSSQNFPLFADLGQKWLSLPPQRSPPTNSGASGSFHLLQPPPPPPSQPLLVLVLLARCSNLLHLLLVRCSERGTWPPSTSVPPQSNKLYPPPPTKNSLEKDEFKATQIHNLLTNEKCNA